MLKNALLNPTAKPQIPQDHLIELNRGKAKTNAELLTLLPSTTKPKPSTAVKISAKGSTATLRWGKERLLTLKRRINPLPLKVSNWLERFELIETDPAPIVMVGFLIFTEPLPQKWFKPQKPNAEERKLIKNLQLQLKTAQTLGLKHQVQSLKRTLEFLEYPKPLRDFATTFQTQIEKKLEWVFADLKRISRTAFKSIKQLYDEQYQPDEMRLFILKQLKPEKSVMVAVSLLLTESDGVRSKTAITTLDPLKAPKTAIWTKEELKELPAYADNIFKAIKDMFSD